MWKRVDAETVHYDDRVLTLSSLLPQPQRLPPMKRRRTHCWGCYYCVDFVPSSKVGGVDADAAAVAEGGDDADDGPLPL